eukprot:scaffold1223_cov105-Skeletonema_dohrnii-CCMP3373.AAC.2
MSIGDHNELHQNGDGANSTSTLQDCVSVAFAGMLGLDLARWASWNNGRMTLRSGSGLLIGSVLIPQSWLDESEENIKIVLENADSLGATPYYAFGGGTVSGSDQANSLSQAHRDAAFTT